METASENAETALQSPSLLDHDAIARRAYELYRRWGYEDGHELAHWFEAERELAEEAEAETHPGLRDESPSDEAAVPAGAW